MSDIEKVKQLREATGAGFKDCNLAVKESGGDLDKKMYQVAGELKVPYIIMHMKGVPSNMQNDTEYDNVIFDIIKIVIF